MDKRPYTNVIANSQRFTGLSDLIHTRFDQVNLNLIFKNLIEIVPEITLPLLAEEFSMTGTDGYHLAVTDKQKRDLIKGAVELHAKKGTPWSIREIMRRLGYGGIEIQTGMHLLNYDGQGQYDGEYFYGDKKKWAYYKVRIFVLITNEEARFIRNVLRYFAPAHCVLLALNYEAAPLIYDGKGNYDGQYNHGEA